MNNPYFNPNEEIKVSTTGVLPHWNQYGKIQYVTFRLADSLPQSKIAELTELKNKFISNHPKPWDKYEKFAYWNLIGPVESKLLDAGYGSCILKIPEIRSIVSDTLKYNDGNKYRLIAYVIMPNHVHVLFELLGNNCIECVMKSIKGYCSRKINELTGGSGSVWMKEYFDRIVRDASHLKSYIGYILNNPKYLKPGEYELWRSDEWVYE